MQSPNDRVDPVKTTTTFVLSHYQTKDLVTARKEGLRKLDCSLDLGLSINEITLTEEHILLRENIRLDWEQVHRITADENNCFLVHERGIEKIITFSETFGRVYSLMPTESAPTLLISGIPMHRIKDTDPYQDTLTKIRTVQPIHGVVLDTATGLGYTAIEAAKNAEQVITVELDPEVLQIARNNPWSRRLFEDPRIESCFADSAALVQSFKADSLDIILHDPPTIALGGDLYSTNFYAQLHRVLNVKGRLFHYIGNPHSPSGGSTTASVIKRLSDVGFRDIRRAPEAFGVVARK